MYKCLNYLYNKVRKYKLLHQFSKENNKRLQDDFIMLSDYYRSGVGWWRYMISTAIHFNLYQKLEKLDIQGMYQYSPTIADTAANVNGVKFNNKLFVKTHYKYHPKIKKAIIFYRNPYDAIKSMYTVELMSGKGNPFRSFGKYNDIETYFIERILEFIEFGEFFYIFRIVTGFFIKYILSGYAIFLIYHDKIKSKKVFFSIFLIIIFILSYLVSNNNYILFHFLKYFQLASIVLLLLIPL